MIKYLLIACLCLAKAAATAQITNVSSDSLGMNAGGIALNRFGVSTIKLKDGTMLKNCAIKELKPLWVVYVKNRTMHDMMKDKIKYIEPEGDNIILWFDEKGNPLIEQKNKYW